MRRPLLVSALALIVALAGCSRSSNPAAPTSGGGVPTSPGAAAVVSGQVRLAAVAPRASLLTDSMTVSVVGTSIMASVSSSGQFTLDNVPVGDVQLRFAGGGNDATVTLSNLLVGQTVTITVTVGGPAAFVESEVRSGSGDVQIEGRVEALTAAPPGSFIVAGRTVLVDGATLVRQGSQNRTFDDLEIGMRVHVKGVASGTDLLARLIEIQNVNGDLPVNVNGVIDAGSLKGTELAFEFTVGSRLIKGDGETAFFGNGGLGSFTDLEDGVRVEVKGQQRDGYVYAARIHVNLDEEEDPEPPRTEDCVHGTITLVTGLVPNLALTVAGRGVTTSSATEVRRRGDLQTVAALQAGQTVSACGIVSGGSTIAAKTIQIQDDAAGGRVQIAGKVGNLKGACPVVTFRINGYAIATSTSTVWSGGGCSALRNGGDADVEGTSQADGSILALTVKS